MGKARKTMHDCNRITAVEETLPVLERSLVETLLFFEIPMFQIYPALSSEALALLIVLCFWFSMLFVEFARLIRPTGQSQL